MKRRKLEKNTYVKISMKLKRLTEKYGALSARLMTAAEVNEKDEAELQKLRELKELKRHYRQAYNEFKEL